MKQKLCYIFMNKYFLLIIFLGISLIANSCNNDYSDELKIIDKIKSTECSRENTTIKYYQFLNGGYVFERSYAEFKAYDCNKNIINESDHLIYGYDSNRVLKLKYQVYTRGKGNYYFDKYTYRYYNNRLSQIIFEKGFNMDSSFVSKELSYDNAGQLVKETNHDKGFYTKTTIIYSNSQKISEIDSVYNTNVNKILVYNKEFIYKNGVWIKTIVKHLNEDYKRYTFYTYRDDGNLVITKDTTISNLPVYKYENNLKASYSVAFNKTESYYKNKKIVKLITYGPDYKTPFSKTEYFY
jgi:hypothetical protein